MILVTNDDGIISPGIRALVEVATEFDEVLVVAPDSPQSAKGHAITVNDPLRLRKVTIFEGVESYECNGTPADCVKLAKNIVAKDNRIKLCVSGINHGSNASINIIYSGTMSAAMEASLEGIPSIGFSLLNFSFDADFMGSKKYARMIMKEILDRKLDNNLLLNVNIPDLPSEKIKGIKVCRQGEGKWVEKFQQGTDPRGEHYYWLTGEFTTKERPEDLTNDLSALKAGYVTIVPSHHDLTKYDLIKPLKFFEE